MSGFMDTLKRFSSGIILFSASVISIGFSAWQYQSDDGGVKWTPSWDTICTTYPGDILRRKP